MNLLEELQYLKQRADAEKAIENDILHQSRMGKLKQFIVAWMNSTGIPKMRDAAKNQRDHVWFDLNDIELPDEIGHCAEGEISECISMFCKENKLESEFHYEDEPVNFTISWVVK